ncbi:potassium channel family protein [Gracilibacillus dipsosauri]|uniref:potassium channel family protein n=1 Tax=Gracilibacillus dipsosauri TaxID=178340 RepID=UPI00240A56F6
MRIKHTAIYEFILFSLALLSVFLIWSDNNSAMFLDRIVWGIFLIDITARFIKSESKLNYIKKHPFDIIAIIPFDAVFQLARFVRLFRVLRMVLIGKHYMRPFFEIIKTNGLDRVIAFTTVLILVSSIPIYFVEPSINSYQDAVWWSIVTSTTVGYGDISPVTALGRIIAILLMLFGIGLIGMVTGSIATYFIKNDDEENSSNNTVQYIKDELDRIDDWTEEDLDRVIYLLKSSTKKNINVYRRS